MKKLLTLAACLIATALLQSQTTIFVTPTGTGDGTSWANACNLETAVDNAVSGNQIWVQSGTHYPTEMLIVPTSVKVYGGFAGTEANLSGRDFSTNITIIDGQQKIGSIFRLGKSSELNGLTIQHGNANDNPHKNGGGVWADDNAIIANCIIQNNAAIANGGGIYAKGNLNLISSTIENNTANKGADLYGNCITAILATGCSNSTFDFGTVSFETPTERTITGTVDGQPLTQIWSDAVTATNCQKTTYEGGSSPYNVDCRTNPNYSGDLFSWCAVAHFAYVLCPAPWRVPTMEDFVNLDKALGGTGANRNGAFAMLPSYTGTGANQWGGAYGGYCHAIGSMSIQGAYASYWSQSEYSSTSGYTLYFYSGGAIYPRDDNDKNFGGTLRCVK